MAAQAHDTPSNTYSDSLSPEAVEPLLRGRFGHPYVYVEECLSTQLLLPPEAPDGTVAATELQTAGRGRLGRRWEAPAASAIQFSVLLRPPPARPPHQLTLAAVVAVAEAIEAATRLRAEIKWPNDVLLDGRKVAGLLAELGSETVVLGVGINVNQPETELPAATRQPAGSLREAAGRTFDRASLLADVLLRLERRYDEWIAGGTPALAEELAARDVLHGREVAVGDLHGRAAGIDPAGLLRVEAGGTVHLVASGEVALVAG